MILTNEKLQEYVGGQMETVNLEGECTYRGDLATISLDGREINVRFAWLGRRTTDQWFADDGVLHCVGIEGYRITGPVDGCITLTSKFKDECVTLFPKGHRSNLDPAKVHNLALTAH